MKSAKAASPGADAPKLVVRFRYTATGALNETTQRFFAQTSPGSIEIAWPGRRRPVLSPMISVAGLPSARPASVSVRPASGQKFQPPPARTRYESPTDQMVVLVVAPEITPASASGVAI